MNAHNGSFCTFVYCIDVFISIFLPVKWQFCPVNYVNRLDLSATVINSPPASPFLPGPEWYLIRVELTVTDVNDNVPEWNMVPSPYLAVVSPDAPAGSLVYKLYALDGDEGNNGEVEYFLSDGRLCYHLTLKCDFDSVVLAGFWQLPKPRTTSWYYASTNNCDLNNEHTAEWSSPWQLQCKTDMYPCKSRIHDGVIALIGSTRLTIENLM